MAPVNTRSVGRDRKGCVCDKIRHHIENGSKFYSLEFFPPNTLDGARSLIARVDRLAKLKPKPLFVDVTWDIESGKRAIETLVAAKAVCSLDVQMHLTCTGITRSMADDLLVEAMDAGIRSILVLRGDPAPGKSEWEPVAEGFKNASELLGYIRQKYGDFFSLSVAGHPGKHPASASQEEYLQHLKRKVDCGADFIVTQMIFKASDYTEFVSSCRGVGIDCPIIPGVLMIPPSLEKLKTVCDHCPVEIPEDLVDILKSCGSDRERVREAGRAYMEKACSEMLSSGAPGLYIYTLNLEKSAHELISNLDIKSLDPKPLPFPRPREKETVRPIFWASNAISYLARTRNWSADFPSQWGKVNDKSEGGEASFVYDPLPSGDEDNVLYSHHSIVGRRLGSMAERRNMWGESPSTEEDVFDVFERFVRGFVPRLPWCERLEKETLASGILKPLSVLNHYGYLTINSQPRVNGAPSEDEQFGWGPRGGYVYQKAYLEFFCSPSNLDRLLEALGSHPSISLEAFNVNGERRCVWTNSFGQRNKTDGANESEDRHISAVTWGVFDGSEVLQPTIVDSLSFQIWSEEAMDMWLSVWASVYPERSESRSLIKKIHANYWHVYMVDNDFVKGDIFKVFSEILSLDPYAGSPVITSIKVRD